jgi:hypothetical protein
MSPESPRGCPGQEAPSLKLASPSLVPVADYLDEIARHIDGAFVLVVRVTGGKYRRRCFLTASGPPVTPRQPATTPKCSWRS